MFGRSALKPTSWTLRFERNRCTRSNRDNTQDKSKEKYPNLNCLSVLTLKKIYVHVQHFHCCPPIYATAKATTLLDILQIGFYSVSRCIVSKPLCLVNRSWMNRLKGNNWLGKHVHCSTCISLFRDVNTDHHVHWTNFDHFSDGKKHQPTYPGKEEQRVYWQVAAVWQLFKHLVVYTAFSTNSTTNHGSCDNRNAWN